jgi:glycogen debranching enzyme
MKEVIRLKDHFYILTTSSMVDTRTRVLKHNDTFCVFDRFGDIQSLAGGAQGLFHEGTRFLSRWMMTLGEENRPLLLSSLVKSDNVLLTVDMTNPDSRPPGQPFMPRGAVHIFRSKFLQDGTCHERLRITNYGLVPVKLSIVLYFEADFADIFEVRGTKRIRKGKRLEGMIEEGRVILAYEGLDGVPRRTRLESSRTPEEISTSHLRFDERIDAHGGQSVITLSVSCEGGTRPSRTVSFDQALSDAGERLAKALSTDCTVSTSHGGFNEWIKRSASDLTMMTSPTPHGSYPYAGVPWFSAPFGRDGIITALESLWRDPSLARGVLAYLAFYQAHQTNPEQDAEPGKILHEMRQGEMAALREIPFGLYYGSVDATPLFVMLAGAYYERTGDVDFIKELWSSIEQALRWIDRYGDLDGDGFVEYAQRSSYGLANQGWKDSRDSIFHRDGSLAAGPIALCEVQGYVYAAKRRASELALVLGQNEKAARFFREAEDLRKKFEKAFWCENLSTFALALDGSKRPCQVRTSNAGHCLWTGIASPEHARRAARTLLSETSFSGWGIRTVDALEARFNPMSYHNGSIWPHDNALIAAGFSRYGLKDGILQVLNGFFDVSGAVELHRLPELFCGFSRRLHGDLTLDPAACSPQSWAASAVFFLLQSVLGLTITAPERRIYFCQPSLPRMLQEITIQNLVVGNASVDLLIKGRDEHVDINVHRRIGNIEIVVLK